MMSGLVRLCVLVGCLGSTSVSLTAQEVVHALTGTVTAINNTAKTITVFQDSGSRAEFKQMSQSKARIALDKRIATETTAASAFEKSGAYAIVFYYGDDSERTVAALKNLGQGPFASTIGTVKKFDGHAHVILVEDTTGKVRTIKIDPTTVAETDFGAVEGMKFQARDGDQVRVVSTNVNGTPTALFIRDR
jgi:hypothetical protein